jgi:GAF domain-containing protein
VLGALTVQSDLPDAFGEMEITIFQALADQLAIALDNARLIAESQHAVKEIQRAYGQINRNAWTAFLASVNEKNTTYRYGLSNSMTTAELGQVRQEVINNGQSAQARVGDQLILLLPITVRDQVIGVISFSKESVAMPAKEPANGRNRSNNIPINSQQTEDHHLVWSDEEVDLLKVIAEQLAVALDSARLYAETRQRAENERLVDQVSSEMRASLDIDAVLETTVRELRDALGLAEVEVRLGSGA